MAIKVHQKQLFSFARKNTQQAHYKLKLETFTPTGKFENFQSNVGILGTLEIFRFTMHYKLGIESTIMRKRVCAVDIVKDGSVSLKKHAIFRCLSNKNPLTYSAPWRPVA
jgi:hypothetical protein